MLLVVTMVTCLTCFISCNNNISNKDVYDREKVQVSKSIMWFAESPVYSDKMPKYFEETPEEVKPKRMCDGLRNDLKTCLLECDCVKVVSLWTFSSMSFITCHQPVLSICHWIFACLWSSIISAAVIMVCLIIPCEKEHK